MTNSCSCPLCAALSDAEASGLLINNLFQLEDGTWRANFRTPSKGHDYREASTLEGVVRSALNESLKERRRDATTDLATIPSDDDLEA